MPQDYTALVAALKAIGIPFAENGWDTRPKADSYGVVALEFEVDALHGENRKIYSAYEGSVDLFSKDKTGGGWVEEITRTLAKYCEGCWSLNSHQWEKENRIFHWEWVFQVEE